MPEYKTFGDFISLKRRAREISSLQMSAMINISPGYYCDIERNRRNPPNNETLTKMINALDLSENDIHIFYDLVGKARSEAPPDLPDYINENEYVRVALRLAKDKGSVEDWKKFIDDLEKR